MVRNGAAIATAVIAVAAISAALVLDNRRSGPSAQEPTTVGLAKASIRDVSAQPFSKTPDSKADDEANARSAAPSAEASEAMQRLELVRPRFQRGGYGSQALLSFTIQNRNDFPVKDVAMRCEFAGPDGRYVTTRTRLLPDTIKTKGRKRFERTLIGFVGVTHAQARCAIVNASRADDI